MFIVIDGADQSAYTVPHFRYNVKDTCSHRITWLIIGFVNHGREDYLHLCTTTDGHGTGPNHIMECEHQIPNDKAREGSLPKCLFIHFYNCRRGDRNRYTLSISSCLPGNWYIRSWKSAFFWLDIHIVMSISRLVPLESNWNIKTLWKRLNFMSHCLSVTIITLWYVVWTKLPNSPAYTSRLTASTPSICSLNISVLPVYKNIKWKERRDDCEFVSSGCEVKCTVHNHWKSLLSQHED